MKNDKLLKVTGRYINLPDMLLSNWETLNILLCWYKDDNVIKYVVQNEEQLQHRICII